MRLKLLITSLLCFITLVSVAWAKNDGELLASQIGRPLFDTIEQATAGTSDGAVMLRNEMAFQAIAGWTSSDYLTDAIRQDIYSHLLLCHNRMESIRRLDSSTPNFGRIAEKGLLAMPALVSNRRDENNKLLPEDKKKADEFFVEAIFQIGGWLLDKYQVAKEKERYRECNLDAQNAGNMIHELLNVTNRSPNRQHIFGIGMTYDTTNFEVKNFSEYSPAKAAGIKVGDEIFGIDGILLRPSDKPEVFQLITGYKDSYVKLIVDRQGELLSFKIPRLVELPKEYLLNVDIVGSLNRNHEADYIYFSNSSGHDLTDVTLYVQLRGQLIGQNGERKNIRVDHLHYVDRWPADKTLIARYMSASAKGVNRDESVDHIETLRYKLYSSEYREENEIINQR